LLRSLDKYRKVLDIEAIVSGVVLSMFPPAEESEPRAKAQRYAKDIDKLCRAASPAIRCLKAKISRDPAYPDSFIHNEPLPFSTNPQHGALVDELQAVAQELGLVGEVV
jgi:hypothetical protein